MLCCQQLPAAGNISSPFERLISLGYYDGTTKGLIQCASCGQEYFYDLLAWDEGQDVRIFGLWPIPKESLASLASKLAAHSMPVWPHWYVQPNSDEMRRILSEADEGLSGTRELKLIVAAEDLTKILLHAKTLTGASIADMPTPQYSGSTGFAAWISFLKRPS